MLLAFAAFVALALVHKLDVVQRRRSNRLGTHLDFVPIFEAEKKDGSPDPHFPTAVPSVPTLNSECAFFPDTSGVLLIMKTGASEAYYKIPAHLLATLKCLPDFLIFSDLSQEMFGHTIYDGLDSVLDEVKYGSKDFDLYFRQQNYSASPGSWGKHHDVSKQAWDLDKYKFVHIGEKAYTMRPNYNWYLFVEADTYVVFPTLINWLKHLDPNKPHYIGSVAFLNDFPYGHGGSGYLVSKESMRAMFQGKAGVANKYDEPVQHVCCGDYIWSKAMKVETHIDVENAVRDILSLFVNPHATALLTGAAVAGFERRKAEHHTICRRQLVSADHDDASCWS